MSFKQLHLELRELRETIAAACRRRLRRSRPPKHQRLHDLCTNFDFENVLSTPLQKARIVVLDTETTGFQVYAGDEIVEIALIEYIGYRRTGREFCSLIRPNISIPPISTKIHGITDDDVANAPLIDDMIEDIVNFIGQSVLVGHHVGFDLRFLDRVTQRTLDCRLPNPSVDTMVLYLAMSGQLDRYGLDEVAEACNIRISNRHSARGDAIACGEICMYLIGKLLPSNARVADLTSISEPELEYGPEYLTELQQRKKTGSPDQDN